MESRVTSNTWCWWPAVAATSDNQFHYRYPCRTAFE